MVAVFLLLKFSVLKPGCILVNIPYQPERTTQRALLARHVPHPTFPPALNLLTPNDPYMGRTAPLTSKRCILYIYSTNIGTEYFKHALYPQFFSLQNAVCFIMLTCLVPILFTFCIQGVPKFKKNNSGAKGLTTRFHKDI